MPANLTPTWSQSCTSACLLSEAVYGIICCTFWILPRANIRSRIQAGGLHRGTIRTTKAGKGFVIHAHCRCQRAAGTCCAKDPCSVYSGQARECRSVLLQEYLLDRALDGIWLDISMRICIFCPCIVSAALSVLLELYLKCLGRFKSTSKGKVAEALYSQETCSWRPNLDGVVRHGPRTEATSFRGLWWMLIAA